MRLLHKLAVSGALIATIVESKFGATQKWLPENLMNQTRRDEK
tara:strand:- start:383 stop:511 length:129 start_codon:yes stop_codon:yes gene_type:complete